MTKTANTAPVDDGLPVKLSSGVDWKVLTANEAQYVRERVKLYNTAFKFVNISDLADVDRVIMLETLTHRMGMYLSVGRDYWGDPIADENALRRQLADLSGELRQLKKSLRLDKASRSADEDADVISYLETMRQRAKAFGIMRNTQAAMANTLAHQLIALVQLHDNCTERERKEMRCTPEEIFTWIRGEYTAKYNAIDKEFRKSEQTTWFQSGEGL